MTDITCCNTGQDSQTIETNLQALVFGKCCVKKATFPVVADAVYTVGQVVDFKDKKAVAYMAVDNTDREAQTMSFIVGSDGLNRARLTSDNAGTPLTDAEVTALLPSIVARQEYIV